MSDHADSLISAETFDRLADQFHARWGVPLCAAAGNGRLLRQYGDRNQWGQADERARAIHEALRWGEATLLQTPDGLILFAAPIMLNARLLGGLVAAVTEDRVFDDTGGAPAIDLTRAAQHLRRLLENENLTNQALLAQRRAEYYREQKRAEAIHELKALPQSGLLEHYLREEPELLSAIRRGDRRAARGVLNRVLVVLYGRGGANFDLIKSLAMELVVIVSRTAGEVGAPADELLGANHTRLAELAGIMSEEALARWLVESLEAIMDRMEDEAGGEGRHLLPRVMAYLQDHYAENISRDDVADAVDLSPSHFSHLLKEQTGRSFTDLLSQVRIDRACQLLRSTDLPLLEVALDTGFSDQSYFTKVFRRYIGSTPGAYRERQSNGFTTE